MTFEIKKPHICTFKFDEYYKIDINKNQGVFYMLYKSQ